MGRTPWPTPTTTPAQIAAIPAGLPTSGWTFWQIAPGVVRVPNRSVTHQSPGYANYNGWEIAARKRMSNRWQMNASFTWNDRRSYDNPAYDRTNFIYTLGYNGQNRYNIKFSGAVQLPGGFTLAQNTIIQEGNTRNIEFNAPVCRFGGLNAGTGAPNACLETGNNPTIAVPYGAVGHDAPADDEPDGPRAQQAVPADARPLDHVRNDPVQPVQREHDSRLLEQQPEPARISPA